MITAKEAKALVENSDEAVNVFIQQNFANQIKQLATHGKHELFHMLGSNPVGLPFKADAKSERTVLTLTALGYNASISSDGMSYVPRGLADDDDNGPEYQNYGILVRW